VSLHSCYDYVKNACVFSSYYTIKIVISKTLTGTYEGGYNYVYARRS